MDALLPFLGCGPFLFIVLIYLLSCLKVVNEYERLVVFTLGKVGRTPKGPGLCFVFRPFRGVRKGPSPVVSRNSILLTRAEPSSLFTAARRTAPSCLSSTYRTAAPATPTRSRPD